MGKAGSSKKQRRAKALQQACDPAFISRALQNGIRQRCIDLRKEVCGLPTHEINFITGLYAGDEEDNSEYGDPIPKCAKKLSAGRIKGQGDNHYGTVRKNKKGGAGSKKKANIAAVNVLNQPDPTDDIEAIMKSLDKTDGADLGDLGYQSTSSLDDLLAEISDTDWKAGDDLVNLGLTHAGTGVAL